jgi:hypothetical protein
VKTSNRTATSKPAKRPKPKTSPAKRGAKPAKAKRAAAKPAKAKPPAIKQAAKPAKAKSPAIKQPAKATRAAKPTQAAKAAKAKPAKAKSAAAKRASPARARPTAGDTSRWLRFVEQHGVVLASARGPVPCVAEAVAGQPIIGSWWAHPKGKAIFEALSELDDSDDVRCFKLVDGKVTFVHRRVWPALACLASGGVIAAGRVASIQQEHMPTGEHRNLVTPFPDWVPDDVALAATSLTLDDARAQLGAWV